MSKSIAILVLDYTPDYCDDCPCINRELGACQACDDKDIPYDDEACCSPKPDWCPLQEAPEYEPIWYDDERSDYERGWNACLDNILGVEEDGRDEQN